MAKRKRENLNSAFRDKSGKIRDYMYNYQYSLRALIASIPEPHETKLPKDIATVGFSEIWPCLDGAVVLIYQSLSNKIEIEVQQPINKTVNSFLRYNKATTFYDQQGNKAPISVSPQFSSVSEEIFRFVSLPLLDPNTKKEYSPRYRHLIIFGWNAELPEPDREALKDFRAVFVTRNVAGSGAMNLSPQEGQNLTAENASKIIGEFKSLLEDAEKEEILQQFLTDHPEFLYPDFIECFPKFKLGDDFVTDYVFLVQSLEGPEYVFVEIERASKEIFTKQGWFAAPFTQAKDQVLEWDKWVSQNQAYILRKLPRLFKPKFHLIMGRSKGLTNEHREKLRTEFTPTSRIFSTYDDLVDRFEQIIARIGGVS